MGARFVKTGMVYLLLGIATGIAIRLTGDRALIALHAHASLAVGLCMVLFGLVYRGFPRAGRSRLAVRHFWMFNISSATILATTVVQMLKEGSWSGGFLAPTQSAMLAVSGSFFVLSFVLFSINVFLNVHDDA